MEAWRKELYLAHHGIKGQTWGVRRGPPYPLGKEARSKNSNSSDSNGRKTAENSGHSSKFHLSDKQKMALLAGVVATEIAAVSLIANDKSFSEMVSVGKLYVNNTLAKIGSKALRSVTAGPFRLKKKFDAPTIDSIADDLSKVNPKKGQTNCLACSIAYAMRASGYDVTARADVKYKMSDIYRMFGANRERLEGSFGDIREAHDALMQKLLSYGEGSKGICMGIYRDEFIEEQLKKHPELAGVAYKGVGHAIAWQVFNGRVLILDGQTSTDANILKSGKMVDTFADTMIRHFKADSLEFMRFNDVADFKAAELIVENRTT